MSLIHNTCKSNLEIALFVLPLASVFKPAASFSVGFQVIFPRLAVEALRTVEASNN